MQGKKYIRWLLSVCVYVVWDFPVAHFLSVQNSVQWKIINNHTFTLCLVINSTQSWTNKYSPGDSRNSSPFMGSPRMSAKGSIMIKLYKKHIIIYIVLSFLNTVVYLRNKTATCFGYITAIIRLFMGMKWNFHSTVYSEVLYIWRYWENNGDDCHIYILFVLCVCVVWFLALGGKCRLRLYVNRVLMRIFGTEREK